MLIRVAGVAVILLDLKVAMPVVGTVAPAGTSLLCVCRYSLHVHMPLRLTVTFWQDVNTCLQMSNRLAAAWAVQSAEHCLDISPKRSKPNLPIPFSPPTAHLPTPTAPFIDTGEMDAAAAAAAWNDPAAYLTD